MNVNVKFASVWFQECLKKQIPTLATEIHAVNTDIGLVRMVNRASLSPIGDCEDDSPSRLHSPITEAAHAAE